MPGKCSKKFSKFQLVVGLHAHTTDGHFPVVSHASQKIIVRVSAHRPPNQELLTIFFLQASNPGQFESDYSEMCWQKGQSQVRSESS